jgi:hypothetical protein
MVAANASRRPDKRDYQSTLAIDIIISCQIVSAISVICQHKRA